MNDGFCGHNVNTMPALKYMEIRAPSGCMFDIDPRHEWRKVNKLLMHI